MEVGGRRRLFVHTCMRHPPPPFVHTCVRQKEPSPVKVPTPKKAKVEEPSAAPSPAPAPSPKKAKAAAAPAAASSPSPPPKPAKKLTMPQLILQELQRACEPMNAKQLAEKLRSTDTVITSLIKNLCERGKEKRSLVSKRPDDKPAKVLYWANQSNKANSVKKIDPAEYEAVQTELTRLANETQGEFKPSERSQGSPRQCSHTPVFDTVARPDGAFAAPQVHLFPLFTPHSAAFAHTCVCVWAAVVSSTAAHKATVLNTNLDASLLAIETEVKELRDRKKSCIAFQEASSPSKANGLGKKEDKRDCDPAAVKGRINNMRTEWVKRKRIANDFVEQLADAMEKKPKEVLKLLELDNVRRRRMRLANYSQTRYVLRATPLLSPTHTFLFPG